MKSTGDMRNAYKMFSVKLQEKKSLGIPGHKWKVVKNDFKEIKWKCLDNIHLEQEMVLW
jgi:hypothetical protein